MATANAEILAVLDAVVRYLSIDLPCQPLTPDAQMGREDLLYKVETLVDKINKSSLADETCSDGQNENETTDDRKRLSSYMDMTQFQLKPPNDGFEDPTEARNSMNNSPDSDAQPSIDDIEQTNYEVTDSGKYDENSVESLEALSYEHENGTELTDDELLHKLEALRNTSPKQVAEGSTCSGYMLKQKKKMISKWNKRYCIIKDWFLFYYKSEKDAKALGVIVLPGYKIDIDEASNKSNKFIFKITPTARGRSTYLFQLTNKDEFDMWLTALTPVCSQKLNRLKSDVFNRVARQLDEKSDYSESNAESGTRPISQQDNESLYEETEQENLYDDHIAQTTNSAMVAQGQDEMYEGIPGETYIPDGQFAGQQPIQEDIYEDIPGIPVNPTPQQHTNVLPSPVVSTPSPVFPAPVLPPRTPVLPPRNAPVRPGNEEIPPPTEARKPVPTEQVELIEEEPEEGEDNIYDDHIGESTKPTIQAQEEDNIYDDHIDESTKPTIQAQVSDAPLENDFLYDNVYIGTNNRRGNEADELTFSRGDIIYVLDKVDPHWWIGCLNDKVGLVPSELLMAGFAH